MRVKDDLKIEGSKCNKIKEELLKGKLSKQQIANKFKVDQNVVFTVANYCREEIIKANEIREKEAENNKVEIKQEQPSNEQKKTRSTKRLDDETILKIVTMVEANVPKTKVAKELGVSYSSVVRYSKEFNVSGKPNPAPRNNEGGGDFKDDNTESNTEIKQIIKPKEVDTTIKEESNLNPKITMLNVNNAVKAGLIKDRHIIPCNLFIFDKITNIFDFDKQEDTINKFIDTYIGFDTNKNGEKIARNDLEVYMTGLLSASASLIKVCNLRKVNLKLFYYSRDDHNYRSQVIWDQFETSFNLGSIFGTHGKISLYNCKFEDCMNGQFYTIKIVDFDSPDKNNRKTNTFIFKDYADVWPFFGDMTNKIMTKMSNKRLAMFADICMVKNNKLVELKRLNKVSNFSSDY